MKTSQTKNERYLTEARTAAVRIAKRRRDGIVTVNDVRKAAPLPRGVNGGILGAVFTPTDWKVVGMTPSTEPAARGRQVRQFALRTATRRAA